MSYISFFLRINEKNEMNRFIKQIIEKSLTITVAVIMAVTCFAIANTDYSYAAKKKKVTSVTLTNVGDVCTMKVGSTKKLKYSIVASKKKYKKVKWKSSNKKIVTVSQKGKIKAKKKGIAYITVYSKSKKKIKDKVKIIVGTPVTAVVFSDDTAYIQKGTTKRLSATVGPSGASIKGLTWTSSNNSIATVSQNGIVKGNAKGTVTIKATAVDGTGISDRTTVKIVELARTDAVFIAHRGYSACAPENTLAAFDLAARSNFHGVEMDVWESEKYQIEVPEPDYIPTMEDSDNPEQSGEENEIPPTAWVDEFDLNVIHSSTTGTVCDKNVAIKKVNNTNRDQYPITKGNGVENYPIQYIPTLDEALKTIDSANRDTGHNTLPVIELKQDHYSEEAIQRILDLIEDFGAENESGSEMSYHGQATIVSFRLSALNQAKEEIDKRVAAGTIAEGSVQILYLVRDNSQDNVDTCISNGFDGISIQYTAVTKSIVDYAHSQGIIVAAWTLPSMEEAARMIDMGVDRITGDDRFFVLYHLSK